MNLNPVQARILGTLIEKEIFTPENYPLSLHALLAGCNQRSSRDPVMELSAEEVEEQLHTLESEGLASVSRDARVPKWEHRTRTVLNLRRDETAVMCLLLLRGAQTPGELRARADRMYSFEDTAAVESTLARLMAASEPANPQMRNVRPLVTAVPRQPGSRETRYMHLLCGPVEPGAAPERTPSSQVQTASGDQEEGSKRLLAERVHELEGHMEALRAMISRIEARLASQSAGGADSRSESDG